MKERLYLGMDGGGTQTRALLVDQTGQVRGAARAGSANINHHSPEQVRLTLHQIFCEVLGGDCREDILAAVFLGLGGVATEQDRQDVIALLPSFEAQPALPRIVIENDTVVGLTGGLAGRPGLTLIAGTGSACLGVNAQGRHWLCGGWGALADDHGSAPWIGLRALQAAVRAEDGRGASTALQHIVFEFLNLDEPRQLVHRIHNHGLERADLGRLAPRVAEACSQEDRVACAILEEAAVGLADMVRVTAERLFEEDACELVLVGGVALSGPPIQSLLIRHIEQACPQVILREPEFTPVQGAVLEALRADGIPWTPELFRTLKGSTP